MFHINERDRAQLTSAERMRANIQRFISEQSAYLQLLAARNRRRAIRQAIDEAENNQEEHNHE